VANKERQQKQTLRHFCAYPRGSKNPSPNKMHEYCLKIKCVHLCDWSRSEKSI